MKRSLGFLFFTTCCLNLRPIAKNMASVLFHMKKKRWNMTSLCLLLWLCLALLALLHWDHKKDSLLSKTTVYFNHNTHIQVLLLIVEYIWCIASLFSNRTGFDCICFARLQWRQKKLSKKDKTIWEFIIISLSIRNSAQITTLINSYCISTTLIGLQQQQQQRR